MSQAGMFENGSAAPNIEFVTGNAGGAVGPDGLFNINIVGSGGITVTGNPGTNTLTISGGGLVWTREAGAAVAIANNHGYFNINAGLTTFTLPATAAIGDIIEIVGEGAGGWTIVPNALQSIQVGNTSTAIGILGAVSSTNRYDAIRLVCRVANLTWSATSYIGTFNIV